MAKFRSCSATVKHSVQPPFTSTVRDSSSSRNAFGNHRSSTFSASRSHVASVPAWQIRMCAPIATISSRRLRLHARPTFSTFACGNHTTYVIAYFGIRP
jgi:hypothetical protein